MRATRQATICALNQMLDLKDLNTGVHSTRLAEWAVRIGQELGLEESGLEDIEVAALLHDAGKVGVPDAILKKPGALDAGEWRVMRMHPEFSWAVLRLVPGLERASLYALHHHEKYNGSGYPGGPQGRGDPDRVAHRERDRRLRRHGGQPALQGRACPSRRRCGAWSPTAAATSIPRWSSTSSAIARAEMSSVFAATGVSQSDRALDLLPRRSAAPGPCARLTLRGRAWTFLVDTRSRR